MRIVIDRTPLEELVKMMDSARADNREPIKRIELTGAEHDVIYENLRNKIFIKGKEHFVEINRRSLPVSFTLRCDAIDRFNNVPVEIVDEPSPVKPAGKTVLEEILKYIDKSWLIFSFKFQLLSDTKDLYSLEFKNEREKKDFIVNLEDLVAVINYLSLRHAFLYKQEQDKGDEELTIQFGSGGAR